MGYQHKGFDDTRRLITAQINGADGDEGKLDQIYKQRYFAGWLDGLGAWRLERRTRSLNFPPFFYNGTQTYEEGVTDGMFIQKDWICQNLKSRPTRMNITRL